MPASLQRLAKSDFMAGTSTESHVAASLCPDPLKMIQHNARHIIWI